MLNNSPVAKIVMFIVFDDTENESVVKVILVAECDSLDSTEGLIELLLSTENETSGQMLLETGIVNMEM